MQLLVLTVTILLTLCLTPKGYATASVYVSPNGSPKAEGTRIKPYTILEAIRRAEIGEVDEIILTDGTYELLETITLSIQRQSSPKLLIRAETPGKAIVSGGTRLKNPKNEKNNVLTYSTDLDPTLKNSRDLYIGNSRAIRARSITYSAWHNKFSAIPGLEKSDTNDPSSVVSMEPKIAIIDHTGETTPIADWKNPEEVEFVFRCAWWEKRIGIDSIAQSQITFAEPGWSIINTPWAEESTSRLNALMPKFTHIEGARELLDSPGEWYNGDSGISIIPTTDFDLEDDDVVVGKLETLLQIKGASGIKLDGLKFSHTTWQLPVKTFGFNEGQANFEQIGKTGHPTEAVGIFESSMIEIVNCTFTQLGGWGLGIFDRSNKISIERCNFLDIAGSAIVIGSIENSVAITAEEQTRQVKVSNSWIHKPASVYHGGVGIFVGFASQVEIVNNEICHAPYTGISLGWGWNSLDSQDVAVEGNSIIGNHVHNYLYSMYDGGGIYTLGPQSNPTKGIEGGLQIRDNIVHNQGGIGNILYSDGGSRWITISSNTTYNNLRELENYYDQKAMYVPDWGGCSPYGNLTFENNILGNQESRSPNFRCAPKDPEPWNPNFALPPETRYVENTFDASAKKHAVAQELSGKRHALIENLPPRWIKQFSTNANELTFEIASADTITFSIENNDDDAFLTLTSETESFSTWNSRSNTLDLPAGRYFLFRKPKQSDTLELSQNPIKIESHQASITKFGAQSTEVRFQTKNSSPANYLLYNRENGTAELHLKSKNGAYLGKSKSWIDHSHHWRTLRALLDSKQPLPSADTRAILNELPSGSFRVEISPPSDGHIIVVATAAVESL
ncbi:right-handed parallel beta-helix repeat-containing protein [Pelagicoccus sp. SDUM812002]|uniref:right-handed parallel beta-helix repeat-containing protein n=1 Tax=Pelagicoccus sp. SDUM812002 TaxID=3041266 RepID=UPI00280CD113|nr:right-handed parallel beta-helix repeat-containing protein [Pelagicoccus sp. SDUM812002]MDQ8185921.1 right-handed parallel beta-helix repeat-containing protein [Pelagicoccus sp. SDUM812002]